MAAIAQRCGGLRTTSPAAPKRSDLPSSLGREGDRVRRNNQGQTPNPLAGPWGRFSLSKLPYRFPVLYGLLLEFRSLHGRIQLLKQRGDICQPQMGFVWEKSALGHLTPNRRTQARTRDTQQTLSLYPWMSPEDWNLFLIGWDMGSEYSVREGRADTPKHNAY